MRWVHVVLNYRYMIIIKIVANIYLALKICRLKKFWESHQLFWACHGRGLIYLSIIIKGNTVVNHCACAFFLAVRARFSHMSNQQDSWCFFCFPMTFWLMGEGGKGKIGGLRARMIPWFFGHFWKCSEVVEFWHVDTFKNGRKIKGSFLLWALQLIPSHTTDI